MKNGKELIKKIFSWVLPLALTVFLVWYLFRKVNFSEMMDIISHGVDYWWILLAMLLSVFSQMLRGLRWRLQLHAIGVRPPFMELCCSIFGCYSLNLLFPRLGEVWRCTYIARREKAPFTKVFGSVVADRVIDVPSVGVIALLAFVLANSAINSYMEQYEVGRRILQTLTNPTLWLAILGVALVVMIVFRVWRETKAVRKVLEWCRQLWQGFAAVGSMPGRWKFLWLTVAIWTMYYIQLYVAFFAFPFLRELCAQPGFGLVPCLVAFVLSAIGMAVPSNGGLGPWNLGIIFGLAVYGIPADEATAFSMVQWSGQTVVLIILGIYTMAYIAMQKDRSSLRKE